MNRRRVSASLCIFLLSVFAALSHSAAAQAGRPVLIDTDPGVDDAIAILLALNSPEIDVKAITVVAGNVVVQQGTTNALKLVSLAHRCDIPVATGAAQPLIGPLYTAEFFHGRNGLADVELPASTCHADSRCAADLIIETVHRFAHSITLVPIGPLTNIALAVRKDPSIVSLVQRVVLMGGSITGGNATAAAEANIHNDPEAAAIVFNAGWPITMVGLNVTEHTLFQQTDLATLQRTRGPENDFAAKLLTFSLSRSLATGFAGAPMHDPLTTATAIDASLVRTEPMRVDVETRGEFTRGETVANHHNSHDHAVWRGDHFEIDGAEKIKPNAEVAVDSNARRFIAMLIQRLAGK